MKILGIGEYHISSDKNDVIKTFSLGSCVAITIHCPVRKVSGMAHIVLPRFVNEQDLIDRPAYFADSAISLMLNEFCYKYGCLLNNLQIGLFGGALSSRENDVFKIGLRNVESIKKILSSKSMSIYMEDTGGYCSRTVEMQVSTGKVITYSKPILM